MAPATEAVIGAVPAAKTGVASATNTVARMVSGALGVAVVGSLVSSLYPLIVEGSLDALPAERPGGGRVFGRGGQRDLGPASTQRGLCSCSRRPATPLRRRWVPAFSSPRYLPARWPSIVIRFLPARESGEAISPSRAAPAASRRRPSVRRKAGVWMILAALVLGAAYLASGRVPTRRLPTGRRLHRGSRRSSASFGERWRRNGSPGSRSASARTTGSPISAASARRTTPGGR